jgi:hypothetical protein
MDEGHRSGAPEAGGATTPASRFGGHGIEARVLRFLARLGRRLTGMAYRNLRRLDLSRRDDDDRVGPAGEPSRTRGAPPPHPHPH